MAARSLADLAATMRSPVRAIAATMLALAGLSFWDGGAPLLPSEAAARVSRGSVQMGGTWVATWQNRRGATRRGLIVVEQRGSQIDARIESHGNVTATGSITGSVFALYGTRLGVPFTITGRVEGRRMTGSLTALLLERRFTATRRRGR